MTTARQFLEEGKALGLSKGQLEIAYQNRIESEGEFDAEPKQYSPTEAYQALREDIVNRVDRRTRQWLTDTLEDEELAREQNAEFFSKIYNQPLTDIETESFSENFYNNISQRQVLESNRRVFNYEPWLTVNPDRNVRPSELAKGFMAGLSQNAWRVLGGLSAIKGKVEEGLLAATMPEYYVEQKDNIQMINDLKFKTLMAEGEAARDYWLTVGRDVPEYIQQQFGYQIGEAFGQLPFAALTVIPPLGMTSIIGQYYAEGLDESNGDHRVAAGYTAIFAPLGYMVDRLTVKAGSGFKNLKPGTKGKYVIKELKKLGYETGGAGFGEFITETAESLSLQSVTKDEVNISQALREGMLAFIVSATGASTSGGVRAVKSVKRIDKLQALGFDEETSTEIINLINDGDFQAASELGVKTFLNIILKRAGASIDSNLPFETLQIPSQYMTYTLDQLKSMKNADAKIIAGIFENIPAYYATELELALQNPNEKTLNVLNQKISDYNKELGKSKKDLVNDSDLSEATEEPVIKTDSETTLDEINYSEFNLMELAEIASDIIATGGNLPTNLKIVVEEKLKPLGVQALNDWQKSVNIKIEQKKRAIKKSKIKPEPVLTTPISDEQALAYDTAIDLFEQAMNNLDITFRNLPEEWWINKTKEYRKRIEEKEGRPPIESFDVTLEFVKKDHIQNTQMKWRELLFDAVKTGDLEVVGSILEKNGAKRGKKLYKNVIAATFAFQKANEFQVPIQKEPTPVSEPAPVEEERSAIEDDFEVESKPLTELDQLTEAAKALEQLFIEDLNLREYDFTQEEMSLIMRHVAYLQGYDPTLEAVNISQLSDNAKKLIDTWSEKSKEIAQRIENVQNALGIDFGRVAQFYFPLRHLDNAAKESTTTDEFIQSAIGATIGRKGQYFDDEGNVLVLENPIRQLEMYLRDASVLIAVGEAITDQVSLIQQNAISIAVAINKEKNEQELTENDENMLGMVQKLNTLQNIASEKQLNIPTSAYSDEFIFSLISQHESYGGGQSLPNMSDLAVGLDKDSKFAKWLRSHGQDWANFVDAHFVVQKMDGIADQEGKFFGERTIAKTKEGNAYGANSELYSAYLRSIREYNEMRKEYNQKLLDIVGDSGSNKTDASKLGKRLESLMFGKRSKIVFTAKTPADIAAKLKIDINIANKAYELAQMVKELASDIRNGRQITSKMSELSSEQIKRFKDLEARVSRGVATEQEIFEYLAYSPKTNKSSDQQLIVRNAIRALFERQAIDDRDFFGYFDSLVNMAGKGRYIVPLAQKIEAWATYLESKVDQDGNQLQVENAKWWRNKVESNLRGEMFSFEDSVLTFIANTIKKTSQPMLGDDLTGSVLDIIRTADNNQIKQGIIQSMGQLQRARINAFLVGNVGWTLTTQPSSLALTIKLTGFSQTFKAISKLIFSDSSKSLLTESDVVSIKSKDQSIGGLESVDEFSELRLKKGLREKIRTTLATVSQIMESKLTEISYLSGYNYGKQNLGLNERDARIHGDFVAASTQSMYDRMTRNTALNSQIMRFFRPMQSYVFTAMSNGLESFGVVGVKKSAQIRAREMARFILAQRLWALIWSYIFGDREEKLFLDPTFDKGTFGSNVPIFGKDIDIKLSELVPWQSPKTWMGDSPPEQFAKATNRIINAAANQEDYPNWDREFINYMFRYVTPMVGIGGNIMLNNFTDMTFAVQNDYEIQDIKGKKYGEYVSPSVARFMAGATFGTKSIDETTKDVKDRGELERVRADFVKREKAFKAKRVR